MVVVPTRDGDVERVNDAKRIVVGPVVVNIVGLDHLAMIKTDRGHGVVIDITGGHFGDGPPTPALDRRPDGFAAGETRYQTELS